MYFRAKQEFGSRSHRTFELVKGTSVLQIISVYEEAVDLALSELRQYRECLFREVVVSYTQNHMSE
jgi:hypothetical protein